MVNEKKQESEVCKATYGGNMNSADIDYQRKDGSYGQVEYISINKPKDGEVYQYGVALGNLKAEGAAFYELYVTRKVDNDDKYIIQSHINGFLDYYKDGYSADTFKYRYTN